MVQEALAAAVELSKEGIEAEVVDPRTLVPFDEDTVLLSIERTGHVVVADEAPLQGGPASAIAGMIAERGFHLLRAPVQRIARADTPVPFSETMENHVTPDRESIIAGVRRLLPRSNRGS